MHVSRTHFADGADLNGDMANQRRDQIGDAASDRSNEQIDSHTPKSTAIQRQGLSDNRLVNHSLSKNRNAITPMRVSRHNRGSHMTGSRSPVQIQINRIAKRLHGLVNGLRAFIAGTVGTGGGQRSGSAQHTQGGRGIRNAHACVTLPVAGSVRTVASVQSLSATAIGENAPGMNMADRRFSGTGRSKCSFSMLSIDGNSTCNDLYFGRCFAANTLRIASMLRGSHATP